MNKSDDARYVDSVLTKMGVPLRIGQDRTRTADAMLGQILEAQFEHPTLYELRKEFEFELEKKIMSVGEAILARRTRERSTGN